MIKVIRDVTRKIKRLVFKPGNKVIANALSSFQKVNVELDRGIALSEKERDAAKRIFETKRVAFALMEQAMEAQIVVNTTDIATAKNVKANLEKMLSGKL